MIQNPTVVTTITGTSGATNALNTSGAAVNVSSAAPGAAGNVLTLTDATHATWQAGGVAAGAVGGPAVIVRVSAQFDKTNTALANVTGLSITLPVGTFEFETRLYVAADVAGGIKVGIAGTATSSSVIVQGSVIDNDNSALTSGGEAQATSIGSALVIGSGSTTYFVLIVGTIAVSVGGTITVQFSQQTATGISSVLVGSTFKSTRIA